MHTDSILGAVTVLLLLLLLFLSWLNGFCFCFCFRAFVSSSDGGDGHVTGAALEELRREILCGKYYNLVSLLAHNFSTAGTLPSYRNDYMLFSHFLEGIRIKYELLYFHNLILFAILFHIAVAAAVGVMVMECSALLTNRMQNI